MSKVQQFEMSKWKNAHHNFTEPKLMSPDKNPKTKDIKFTLINIRHSANPVILETGSKDQLVNQSIKPFDCFSST